jgi:hypothetical protein
MSIYKQINSPLMHKQTDTNHQMGYASTVGGGAMTMVVRRQEQPKAYIVPASATAPAALLASSVQTASSPLIKRRAA